MKRILVWLLSVAMVIGLAVVPASAAGAQTVSGETKEVNMADGSFTYDVSIENNAGNAVAAVKVTWPETELELTEVTFGDIMPNAATPAVENSGSFKVSLGDDLATSNYEGDGVLFTLSFTILDAATAGDKAIGLDFGNAEDDFMNVDMDTVETTFAAGSVTLVDGEAAPEEPTEEETQAPTPVIDPNGKTLKEDGDSVDITITCDCTTPAAIYFTLNGGEETEYTEAISLFTSGGAIYTSGGAVNLGTSVTLKAWAVVEGLLDSEPATAEFKIQKKSSGGGGGGSTPAAEEDTFPFKDVPENAYFRKAVEWAWKNGITAGTSETTFSPYLGATRGQMMTYLWAAAGCPEPSSTDNPFTDVAEGAYYYKAVLWAVEKGITAGTSATTFSPDQTVTRAQAITFLYGAAGRPEGGSEPFTDVNEGDYFAAPVAWAYSKGITVGISDTEFGPAEICQRCQIVQFLYLHYAAE